MKMAISKFWPRFGRRIVIGATGLAVALGIAGYAVAQEKFPSRPIELIVTFGAGGGADAMARKVSQLAERALGVPVQVSNVAGASGNIGLTRLLTNDPDGYTLGTLIALTVSSWASGFGAAEPDAFTVLAVMQDTPSMLFVPADSPFKTFKDFLDYAKANPKKLKVSTSGFGTTDDIALKLLALSGYRTINLPFSQPKERYASVLEHLTDAIYEEPGDVAQYLASQQYRPLVVFDSERHPAFKDVPTAKEFGLAIDMHNFRALVAPVRTPPDRVKILVDAFDKVLDSSEWKKFCAETYTCTRKYTPEEGLVLVKNFYETVRRHVTPVPPPFRAGADLTALAK